MKTTKIGKKMGALLAMAAILSGGQALASIEHQCLDNTACGDLSDGNDSISVTDGKTYSYGTIRGNREVLVSNGTLKAKQMSVPHFGMASGKALNRSGTLLVSDFLAYGDIYATSIFGALVVKGNYYVSPSTSKTICSGKIGVGPYMEYQTIADGEIYVNDGTLISDSDLRITNENDIKQDTRIKRATTAFGLRVSHGTAIFSSEKYGKITDNNIVMGFDFNSQLVNKDDKPILAHQPGLDITGMGYIIVSRNNPNLDTTKKPQGYFNQNSGTLLLDVSQMTNAPYLSATQADMEAPGNEYYITGMDESLFTDSGRKITDGYELLRVTSGDSSLGSLGSIGALEYIDGEHRLYSLDELNGSNSSNGQVQLETRSGIIFGSPKNIGFVAAKNDDGTYSVFLRSLDLVVGGPNGRATEAVNKTKVDVPVIRVYKNGVLNAETIKADSLSFCEDNSTGDSLVNIASTAELKSLKGVFYDTSHNDKGIGTIVVGKTTGGDVTRSGEIVVTNGGTLVVEEDLTLLDSSFDEMERGASFTTSALRVLDGVAIFGNYRKDDPNPIVYGSINDNGKFEFLNDYPGLDTDDYDAVFAHQRSLDITPSHPSRSGHDSYIQIGNIAPQSGQESGFFSVGDNTLTVVRASALVNLTATMAHIDPGAHFYIAELNNYGLQHNGYTLLHVNSGDTILGDSGTLSSLAYNGYGEYRLGDIEQFKKVLTIPNLVSLNTDGVAFVVKQSSNYLGNTYDVMLKRYTPYVEPPQPPSGVGWDYVVGSSDGVGADNRNFSQPFTEGNSLTVWQNGQLQTTAVQAKTVEVYGGQGASGGDLALGSADFGSLALASADGDGVTDKDYGRLSINAENMGMYGNDKYGEVKPGEIRVQRTARNEMYFQAGQTGVLAVQDGFTPIDPATGEGMAKYVHIYNGGKAIFGSGAYGEMGDDWDFGFDNRFPGLETDGYKGVAAHQAGMDLGNQGFFAVGEFAPANMADDGQFSASRDTLTVLNVAEMGDKPYLTARHATIGGLASFYLSGVEAERLNGDGYELLRVQDGQSTVGNLGTIGFLTADGGEVVIGRPANYAYNLAIPNAKTSEAAFVATQNDEDGSYSIILKDLAKKPPEVNPGPPSSGGDNPPADDGDDEPSLGDDRNLVVGTPKGTATDLREVNARIEYDTVTVYPNGVLDALAIDTGRGRVIGGAKAGQGIALARSADFDALSLETLDGAGVEDKRHGRLSIDGAYDGVGDDATGLLDGEISVRGAGGLLTVQDGFKPIDDDSHIAGTARYLHVQDGGMAIFGRDAYGTSRGGEFTFDDRFPGLDASGYEAVLAHQAGLDLSGKGFIASGQYSGEPSDTGIFAAGANTLTVLNVADMGKSPYLRANQATINGLASFYIAGVDGGRLSGAGYELLRVKDGGSILDDKGTIGSLTAKDGQVVIGKADSFKRLAMPNVNLAKAEFVAVRNKDETFSVVLRDSASTSPEGEDQPPSDGGEDDKPPVIPPVVAAGLSSDERRDSEAILGLGPQAAMSTMAAVHDSLSRRSFVGGIEGGQFGLIASTLYRNSSLHRGDGGHVNLYGGLLGVEYGLSDNFGLGLSLSAGAGKAKDFQSGNEDLDFTAVNAYAAYMADELTVRGEMGYLGVTGKPKGGSSGGKTRTKAFSVGLNGSYKLAGEYVDITPHLGLQYIHLGGQSTEYGDLAVDGDSANLFQMPVGLKFSKDFATDDMSWRISPSVDLGAVFSLGSKSIDGKVASGGRMATVTSDIADKVAFQGGIGLKAQNSDGLGIHLDYALTAGSGETDHSLSLTVGYQW